MNPFTECLTAEAVRKILDFRADCDTQAWIDIDSLLAATDDKRVAGLTSPPSSVWRYAKLPEQPGIQTSQSGSSTRHTETNFIQFAIGGRVYPMPEHWTHVTPRFRGHVLKNIARTVSDGRVSKFAELNSEVQARISGISGTDAEGHPLTDHSHAYFCIHPDASGMPTRLICDRKSPFSPEETEAILAASQDPISWQYRSPTNDQWQLQLVPLPFGSLASRSL